MKIKTLAMTVLLTACVASATTVKWDFPCEGCCHEGIPFADGRTGILVWGGGDTINLTAGRGDLWDHRGGFPWTDEQSYANIIALVEKRDAAGLKAMFSQAVPGNWNPTGSAWTSRYNPYMLPLGRVTMKLGGATLASGELDTATGLGKLVLADGREIMLAMSKARRLFAMKVPRGLKVERQVIPATDFPIYKDLLKYRGFKRAERDANGFTWELPVDKPVSLGAEKVAEADGETLYVWTRRDEPACCANRATVGFAGVADDSRTHWRDFWQEGARITVPDLEVQELFDFGMYKFGSMTDPDGFPAGLQGQWLEDDKLVPWNGDYHFNINVQECYSPAYRGGHFHNLMPLFRMVLSWRPILRDNAKKFVGIANGYVLPHSVDDRGVCIGGFWAGTIDHASTAWVASMMYRYVRYSGDVAFLKDGAYDFMKGAMNVYRAMMEEKDGRLSIPVGPSPEWGDSDVKKCVGRDPSFQLAAAHRLVRDLVSAAERLGETPDLMWLDVEKRLPPYTKGLNGFQLFEGQPFVESHRHHSHMAGLYPFDTIDLADRAVAEDVKATYRTWVRQGTGLWSGWCVPWAAILHAHVGHPDAAVQTLRAWKAFYNNPGHGSLHDAFNEGFSVMSGRKTIMQMDGACAAVTAVMELMAHETNGRVEFFKGCPSSWKSVSFENLALSDGTRVNGRRTNGKVEIEKVGFGDGLPPAIR